MSRSPEPPPATARPAPTGVPRDPNTASPAPAPRPPDAADLAIREALAAGAHRRALALAMQLHGDGVYHYCRRMVGDAMAPDLQQQVYIDVYRGLAAFDGRSKFRTWVFSIARNRCIDALRLRDRRRDHQLAPLDDVADLADDGPDPAAVAAASERHAALRFCIDKLAPTTRSAVLLRYQEGLAYEEMAIMCNEPAGTLGRRVSRALVALRACVERQMGSQP